MVYIVLGMHRSGTSLVSGILHSNGVMMGLDFQPEPSEHNPKGYYEDIEFRTFNDAILAHNNYDVKSWATDIPTVSTDPKLIPEMKKLILSRQKEFKNWGFKDPRTMLTFPVWSNILPVSTHIVFVHRHPLKVANSLLNRGDVKTIRHGLELWFQYNLRGLALIDRFPKTVLSYEKVLQGEIKIADLKLKRLDLIDTNLNRSQPEGKMPEYVRRLYEYTGSLEK